MGFVYNTKAMLMWSIVFFVPPVLMLAWNRGRLSMPPEELMQTTTYRIRSKPGEEVVEERKAALQKVLFETNDAQTGFRQEWAIKRDEERKRRAEERAERIARGEIAWWQWWR